jgi:flagellar biosynthetic protein FlhB
VAGGEAGEKTEAATPRKRNELRRQGQVAKSQDFSSMVVFMGTILVLHAVGSTSAGRLRDYLKTSLSDSNTLPLTSHVLYTKAWQSAGLIAATIGPYVLTAMLLGVAVNMLQTGFLIAPQAMKPNFNRLNPLTGITRVFSARGLVETAKAVAKLAIISWIAWSTINGGYQELLVTIRLDLPAIVGTVGDMLFRLVTRIIGFLLVLAAVDFGYQRYSFEKSIRMTKQEVKMESKQQEGDPLIKSRIRARQRQMAKARMMSDVPLADVIITNPTHFAVALKYDGATMVAPKVVAKGADLVAQRIRELATENDIPIVENPPLARNLYKNVEIGREIPPELFAAVAEVLAYVYAINARRKRRSPAMA